MRNTPTAALADCTEFRQILQQRPARFIHCMVLLLVLLLASAVIFLAVTEADLVVRASGRVRPVTDPVKIFSGEKFSLDIGARIVQVSFRKGDKVRQGDVLIRLGIERLDNRLAKLERTMEAGEQELAKLQRLDQLLAHEFVSAQAKAKAELEQATAEIVLLAKRQATEVAVAKLELAGETDALNRFLAIQRKRSRVVTDREVLQARIRAKTAAEKLTAARLPVDRSKLKVFQKASALREREYQVRCEELSIKREARRAEVEAAQLDLRNLQLERAQAIIRSSTDGVVTSQEPKVGDVIELGQPLVEIAPQDGFHFHIAVSSDDVGHLRLGMPTRVKLDAYDYQQYGVATGTLRFISPDSQVAQQPDHAQQVAVYAVEVELDQQEVGRDQQRGQIKLGMTGQADIVTDRQRLLSLLVRRIGRSISLN